MEKYQWIDRHAYRYDEVVTDKETGEVTHECHEDLRDHKGDGSAKG